MTAESHSASSGSAQQSEMRDKLKNDARHMKDTMQGRAKQEAETRKGQTAHAAQSASSAMNAAADELQGDPDAPDWMASALQQAARKVEDMASRVEGRSVDDITRDIAGFARQHPSAFLAASAAVGFAAARVLRAGADKQRHDQQGVQSSQSAQTAQTAQGWPADENVRPERTTGDFAPAYMDTDANAGGVLP